MENILHKARIFKSNGKYLVKPGYLLVNRGDVIEFMIVNIGGAVITFPREGLFDFDIWEIPLGVQRDLKTGRFKFSSGAPVRSHPLARTASASGSPPGKLFPLFVQVTVNDSAPGGIYLYSIHCDGYHNLADGDSPPGMIIDDPEKKENDG